MKNRTRNAFGTFANNHFCVRERCFWMEKKPHPKTEKDRCKPLHLVLTSLKPSLKRLVTIVFRWWKRQCESFSEVKKSNYRLTFHHLFRLHFIYSNTRIRLFSSAHNGFKTVFPSDFHSVEFMTRSESQPFRIRLQMLFPLIRTTKSDARTSICQTFIIAVLSDIQFHTCCLGWHLSSHLLICRTFANQHLLMCPTFK